MPGQMKLTSMERVFCFVSTLKHDQDFQVFHKYPEFWYNIIHQYFISPKYIFLSFSFRYYFDLEKSGPPLKQTLANIRVQMLTMDSAIVIFLIHIFLKLIFLIFSVERISKFIHLEIVQRGNLLKRKSIFLLKLDSCMRSE